MSILDEVKSMVTEEAHWDIEITFTKLSRQFTDDSGILQSMKYPSVENVFSNTRSRGGLVAPCTDLVQIVEIGEMIFRHFVVNQTPVVSTIPCDTCNEALESPLLKSLWENILQGWKD